jgi:hypothetical protein
VIHYHGFADGDGYLSVYKTCGERWWVWLSMISLAPSRVSRFFDFRESFGGWAANGFDSESQAQACAKVFVESENAISPGHAPEQGD